MDRQELQRIAGCRRARSQWRLSSVAKNGVEVATTTSGADGSYSFTSLSAGTYVVQAYAPPDYQFTTQNVGSDRTIDSNGNPDGTSGEIVIDAAHPSDNTIDFGLVSMAGSATSFGWIKM